MKRFRLPVALTVATLLVACASSGSSRAGGSENVLTYDELLATSETDLFNAIQSLRPRWLRPRGLTSLANVTVRHRLLRRNSVRRRLAPERHAAHRHRQRNPTSASATRCSVTAPWLDLAAPSRSRLAAETMLGGKPPTRCGWDSRTRHLGPWRPPRALTSRPLRTNSIVWILCSASITSAGGSGPKPTSRHILFAVNAARCVDAEAGPKGSIKGVGEQGDPLPRIARAIPPG